MDAFDAIYGRRAVKHFDPDHEIDNDPQLEAAGRDQQLETAVEVLLATLDGES